MQAYQKLEAAFGRMYRLNHLLALASWDAQVNMPTKAAEARGDAMAELEGYVHELLTSKETRTDLDTINSNTEEQKQLTPFQRANLREMQRMYQSESLLPDEFVQRKSKLVTKAQVVWQESRAKNSFQTYLPVLKELVATAREEGKYRAGDSGKPIYEALLDVFEPGMRIDTLDKVFSDVKTWLPGLLKQIMESQQKLNESSPIVPINTPISREKQEALGRHFMKVWQFDLDAGRLDVSAHPFTGMTKEDVRITTHYDENDVESSLYAVIHETGHAKYEQNCGPRDLLTQPVCNARSLGVHESQSLFAEMQVGRSGNFSHYLTPLLKEYFGDQPAFEVENVKRISQKVKPGFIRVHADEVSYPLHIILRYEIERALIEGTMEAEDVPRVWNSKMQEYLGLDPADRDDLGCLQDIHWSGGAFGYFPTYTLGSMFAAQLMACVKREMGEAEVSRCIREGDLAPILAKQKEKIWDHGCVYETEELMERATGERLNPKYFREHLERRYLRGED